ncbi:hypothetical protein BGZ52_002274 [Haplosporangium bisporale]|nr:hypothetical protein BGZ52_002274 [Haplosporangium bisporale]
MTLFKPSWLHETPSDEESSAPVPPIHNPSAKPDLPFTPDEIEALSKPKVLISGGGIGGSVMSLGASLGPLFKQLGIYDEFVRRGKHFNQAHMYKEDLKHVHTMEGSFVKEAVGHDEYVLSRPELYDLLFNSIPRERILLGKRVLSFSQTSARIVVQCSDNSKYHGDILVGADGAYSAVRQQLYKYLKVDKALPAADNVTLPFGCVCLVGQTEVLDPEVFPDLKENLAQVNNIMGVSTMCTWVTCTTKQNTVCWLVIQYLNKDTSKMNDSFRCSEWGPEAAEALAREARPFKVPGGKDGKTLTLGDYIDRTPKHLMSKVMLEEIVFKTWFGGRTVLMGDACHKMNPSGGGGAVRAIDDAVTLANWLSTLRMASEEDIENVFKEYRAERYPIAKEAFVESQMFSRNLGKRYSIRNQASFLPLVKDNAPVRPAHQPSLHKTLTFHKKMAKDASAGSTESNAATV